MTGSDLATGTAGNRTRASPGASGPRSAAPPRWSTSARGPVVLFTRDPQAVPWWWLHHYFPATARLEASRETLVSELGKLLGCQLDVIPVPIPADCTDGFNAAYWRRPAAYLDPAVWRPMSAISLIPEADRAEGMRRLAADLDSGEWHRHWGYLLTLSELDLGYRVLTCNP